ncbi:hypothetical protein TRVA0_003S03510 [Trichomonascus vanleenenianus]|uniref:Efr3p n=1 Tax=Trichomonascus vanleenenianus TaxID=2268995 RepID=UPI003ECA8541
MKNKLASKHQKLILQCYPAGRGVEKRPNASELSYLLYYVSTRRVKLAKVGLFLEKLAKSDVYRGRSGNVAVTLDILKALIQRTPEDLNMFAWHVVAIISNVFSSNDLALCQHAAEVYSVFCSKHDTALFTGDADYVKAFRDLVEQFIAISSNPTGPNALQWRTLGINCAKSTASSAVVSTPSGQFLIGLLIPLVLSTLPVDQTGNVLEELKTQLEYADSQKNSDETSAASKDAESEEKPADKLYLLAFEALRSFFQSIIGFQLRYTTRNIVEYLMKVDHDSNWCTTLIIAATRWTPVQLRFAILQTLVDCFVGLNASDVSSQLDMCRLITSLLNSSVNMAGLAVMDVLRALVSHQHRIIQDASEGRIVGLNQVVDEIKNCIIAITTHIYYADQISDMVTELLSRCHTSTNGFSSRAISYVNLAHASDGSPNGRRYPDANVQGDILKSDLENVKEVIDATYTRQSGLEPTKVPFSAWEGTQGLLNHENPDVRLAYVSALVSYLKRSISENDRNLKIHKTFNVTRSTFGRLVLKAYLKAADPMCTTGDYILLAHLFTEIVQNMGINGIVRILPFSLMLQDLGTSIEHDSSQEYSTEQGTAVSSLFILILSALANQLDSPELQDEADRLAEDRKTYGFWYKVFDYPLEKDIAADYHSKKNVVVQTPDIERAKLTVGLPRDTIAEFVNISEFPKDLMHVLFEDAPLFADSSAGTETNTDSGPTEVVITKARSLKDLAKASNTALHQSHTPTSSSQDRNNGTVKPNSNGTDARREFSPKVSDLKRVASGHLKPSFATKNRSYSMMSASTYSTVEENDNPPPIPQHDFNATLDMSSFLDHLNIHSDSERGRLA